jgi:isopentenyl-diphosphate Delta-isomerase
MEDKVILVNEEDEQTGIEGKEEVHKRGLLHRAFSVFIFNRKGEMLLQQRNTHKYHSGGLWSNTCCSHPKPGEEVAAAALRRLKEEMGFETSLEKIFDFVYRIEFENGLTEHEFDHVFAGEYDGKVMPSEEEVKDYCYKKMDEIRTLLQTQPSEFTQWFRLAFPGIDSWWQKQYNIIDRDLIA